mmetsp:Transcript_23313/g.41223  ORF Transcript_23313/g.41223 Transcript_23313/m.41223 type:complete len:197 (-) Transcript_23313:71-661(-)
MAGLERRFKIVVLGRRGVGKTSLTLRFARDLFDEDQLPTVGAAYMTKKVELDDQQYIFEFWDTAGQERYEAITPLYYRSAEAAVIVFDLTLAESFTKAKEWLKRLRKERPDPDMPIALAGNKSDCEKRAIDEEELRAFVEENGLQYYETSAKTGDNVDSMFKAIARSLPPLAEDAEDTNEPFPVTNTSAATEGGCC